MSKKSSEALEKLQASIANQIRDFEDEHGLAVIYVSTSRTGVTDAECDVLWSFCLSVRAKRRR